MYIDVLSLASQTQFMLSITVHNCSVVDGGWSSWIEGSCSKSCGGGIRIDTRTCDNPTPDCEGLSCEGSSTHEEQCNQFCCPSKYLSRILYTCILKFTV